MPKLSDRDYGKILRLIREEAHRVSPGADLLDSDLIRRNPELRDLQALARRVWELRTNARQERARAAR